MFILDSALSAVVSAFIQDKFLIQYLNRLFILSEIADYDISEVLLRVISFIQIKYIFALTDCHRLHSEEVCSNTP